MKKMLFLLLLLFLVSALFSLVACTDTEKPLQVGTPPETTAYTPPPLNIEFFDEVPYTNMTPFEEYNKPTNLPETTGEESSEVTPEI